MARALDKVRGALRRFCTPFLAASPKERLRWLLLTVVFSAAAVGAELWFYENYRIAWDRQILKCMNVRFLLVDLKDREVERGKIYAYEAARTEPVVKDGTLVGKIVRGVPGDKVEVRPDETVWVNGVLVAEGMPHLTGMSEAQKARFFGERTLKSGEYWFMGTNRVSFDSRYSGPVRQEQIVGRAYVLY